MNVADEPDRKFFTVNEANATLPLVRVIVGDAMQLAQDIAEREQRLDLLQDARGEGPPSGPYAEELEEMQCRLRTDKSRLRGFVDELTALGIRPKSLESGLVDFPCWMDDREVELCWKFGEPEVLYWHAVNAGFAARRPVPAASTS